ncbi:MAG: cytidine deaminase, partial [Ruminococcaceae bacterium]|nr:cytidine deaminase [Oscillospiraceae bacterium]
RFKECSSLSTALLTKDGKVYKGCNIENAAFGPTNCAERTAFFKAISEGDSEFSRICVVGGKGGNVSDYFYPCGVCRQVMAEFCDDSFEIIVAKSCDDYKVFTLDGILPQRFSKSNVSEV